MKNYKKGFFQIGIVIFLASVFAAGFVLSKYNSLAKFKSSEAWDGPVPNVTCSDENHCGGVYYPNTVVEGCVVETEGSPGSPGSWVARGRLAGCGSGDGEPTCPAGTVFTCANPPQTVCTFRGTCAGKWPAKWLGTGSSCDKNESKGLCQTNCFCQPIIVSTPSPSPTLTPTHSPSPVPTPTRSPSPTPTPTPTPICTPKPTKSPSPTPKPTNSPSCTPKPTKSPSPTPSATPLPQCNSFCLNSSQCLTGFTCSWGKCRNPSCTSTSNCICQSPTPSPTPSPSKSPKPTSSPTLVPTYSPSPTPITTAKLRICKYNDKNNNGSIDDGEGTMGWSFIYKYQDQEHRTSSGWWKFNNGCVTVNVPISQWINVKEEGRNRWNLTGVYQDSAWVGTNDYNYVAQVGETKEVKFLNYYSPDITPTPTSSGTPNWCNGTCGSNYNCQGGFFCYQGYCRNPACSSDSSCGCGALSTPTPSPVIYIAQNRTAPPVVLGATAPPVLPKTGSNDVEIVLGLSGLIGAGVFLFRKFRLV